MFRHLVLIKHWSYNQVIETMLGRSTCLCPLGKQNETKIFWWLLHHQPLRDPPHDLTSHLHERRLMELSLKVQELPLVPPDGDGLGRLPWQWISKCSQDSPFKLCRLRVMLLFLVFYYKSALVLQMLFPTGKQVSVWLSNVLGVRALQTFGFIQNFVLMTDFPTTSFSLRYGSW